MRWHPWEPRFDLWAAFSIDEGFYDSMNEDAWNVSPEPRIAAIREDSLSTYHTTWENPMYLVHIMAAKEIGSNSSSCIGFAECSNNLSIIHNGTADEKKLTQAPLGDIKRPPMPPNLSSATQAPSVNTNHVARRHFSMRTGSALLTLFIKKRKAVLRSSTRTFSMFWFRLILPKFLTAAFATRPKV